MDPEETNPNVDEVVEESQPSPIVKKRKADDSPTKSHKKPSKVAGIDDEASESGDEEGSGSDNESVVEEENNYKYNEFLVPDDAKDTDSEDEEKVVAKPKTKLKKLMKSRAAVHLDEEDELLIQENIAQGIEDLPQDEEGLEDDEEIAPELNNDPESAYDAQKEKRRNFFEPPEIDDDSDMGSFIEKDQYSDEEGEETEEAKLQRMRAQHSQRRQGGKRDGPTFDQIQEAMDIFGAGYDSGFDDEAEPEDDDEAGGAVAALGGESDDEAEGGAAGAKLSSKDKKLINKMRSRYERSQLVASFCTDRDEELRNVDVPERFQSIMKGRGVPDDEERSREAQWMAEKLAVKISEEQRARRASNVDQSNFQNSMYNISQSSFDLNVDILRNQLAEPIQAVLKYFQVERLEVPFIWVYRKDYLHPQMTRNHLWLLLDLDQQWEALFVLNNNLQMTITALSDAAHSTAEQDEEEKAKMAAEVEFQLGFLRDLQEEVRAAEEKEKELMDYVDNNDDHTQEDRDRVTDATEHLEALRGKLPPVEEEVSRVKERAEQLHQRIVRKGKYSPAAAAEVMRLFPKDRYEVMMQMATDEVEIRDISRFLTTLMQGSEVTSSAVGQSSQLDGMDNTQQSEGGAAADAGLTQNAGGDRRNNISKRSEYTKYKNLPGVRTFAEYVCLPVCELGDSIRMNMRSEPKATGATSADEIAIQFVDDKVLRSEQKVVSAAVVVIATEMSVEPTIRKIARDFFKSRAQVTTRPTDKGLTAITPFSEYFGLHYLDNKPLSDFYLGRDKTLFIRLAEAEKLGLITVTVQLPQTMQQNNEIGNDVRDLFVRLMRVVMPQSKPDQDSHQAARQSWDTVRITVLSQCIEKYLLPSLLSECKRDLLRIGKETIVEEAAANFEKMLKVGPYRVPNQDGRAYIAELLRSCPNGPPRCTVMSIFQSTGGSDPLCMAFVDKDGVLRAHDLLPTQAQNQKFDRIKKFILDNKPGLIVLNASAGYQARSLSLHVEKNILKEVGEAFEAQHRAKLEQREMDDNRHHRDDEDEGPYVPYKVEVLIVKDEVANIFQGSSRAKTLLPELQPGGAAAVCLARFVQEPLSEYCNIWTSANAVEVFGYEAFFLNVHPLKSLLQGAKASLLKMMEYKLISAVCDVGVDINKSVAMDHHAALLAFVGGLGLRKADALRQNVRRTLGTVVSRNNLLVRKLLGKNVWANSSGFIRICDNGLEKVLDPLDNTRIHPECYVTFDFAPKICADALEVDNNPADYVDIVERLMQQCQRELERRIRKHPRWLDLFENGEFPVDGITEFNEKIRLTDGKEVPLSIELHDSLSQLLLDEFAQDLEIQKKGKRRLQLQHIKDELRFPWLDLRSSVRGISPSEFFSILTGETDSSLYVGLKLGCTVLEISDSSFFDERSGTHKRRQRAVVKTDNGLRGYISVYDAFDVEQHQYFDYDSVNLSKYVQVGMHMPAVVIGVKKDRLQLDLSIKESHLTNNEAWWIRRRSEKPLKEWWDQCRPGFNFDPYFSEHEALEKFTAAENSQIRTSQAVGAQLSAVSLSGDKGGSGAAGAAGGNKMLMRMVHHPLFANLDFKATEDRMRLEGKGAGEVLIRPSSKGPDYLTITWAFQNNWYKHISVQERGKRPGDLGLGSQLLVMEPDMQREVYSDLDEVYARYIDPMNELVNMMIGHRNFMSGSVEEVEAEMKLQLTERAGRIPYFVRFEPTRPGAFVLTWLSLNARSEVPVKKELIEVRPYGYKIRSEVFARPSELIMWFKTTTEAAAAAAMAQSRQAPPTQQQHQGAGGDGAGGNRRPSRFNPIDRNTVAANNSYGSGGAGGGMGDSYGRNQMPVQQSYGNQAYGRGY